nr:cryptochrome/photolyase family protein [uncultured Allomuricauda sp.]
MRTLRLFLGDQLNLSHSWLNQVNDDHIYLMAEMRQETDYVKHHIQKVTGFFLFHAKFCKYFER